MSTNPPNDQTMARRAIGIPGAPGLTVDDVIRLVQTVSTAVILGFVLWTILGPDGGLIGVGRSIVDELKLLTSAIDRNTAAVHARQQYDTRTSNYPVT